MQSYIVNGVRSKSSKNKIALYQPLTLLDMVVYYRENANINRIKELKCLHPYQSLSLEVKKSSMAMFITEMINKTVREESHAHEVFEFLFQSLVTLDGIQGEYENFHLVFLVKLSRFLGFGAHTIQVVLGGRMADIDIEKLLENLIQAEYEDRFTMTNPQRREVLELILKFYADHIDTLGEIKSVQVLREVLG